MPAATYDFDIEQGATFSKTITWKDADGNPINLTGYTARMQFRKNKAATDILFNATSSNGKLLLGGSAGTIDINIAAADTAAFDFSRAVYDIELQSSGGTVTRLLEGAVNVSKEVTR